MTKLFTVILLVLLTACTGLPDDIKPVQSFDANRYLGQWYEIARLDHSFEKGLMGVSAEYQLGEDGCLRVINRGKDEQSLKWKVAEGKACFVRTQQEGYLKVSFFGPFYGTYAIFGLDAVDYQHAFVAGYSKDYLWLLSRTRQVSDTTKSQFLVAAKRLGFAVDELIWVNHH
jgi:apolipoprotein D and lipocalin family protein